MIDEPRPAQPPDAPAEPQAERDFKAVLADLVEHSRTLVRQEVELGRAELDLRVDRAKAALVRGAISAGLYYAAYLTTLASAVLLLAEWMAPWLAALVIAIGASAGAVVFTRLGRQAVREVAQETPEIRSFTRRRAHT